MSTTQSNTEPSCFAKFDYTAQQISDEVSGKIPHHSDTAQSRRHHLAGQASAHT